MSNEITVSNEFAAIRVSAKGKETYRGALGVITSGNTAERGKMAATVIEALWANSTYRPLVRELARVYAPLFKVNKTFGMSFVNMCGLYESSPNKEGMLAFFRAVVKAEADKPSKGEKLIYVNAMRRVLEAEQARLEAQAEKEAEQDATVATN